MNHSMLAQRILRILLLQVIVTSGWAEPLIWDASEKEYRAKEGESTGSVTFQLRNGAAHDVIVTAVSTSCGCTVAKVPALPWKVSAGASDQMDVTVTWLGKTGKLTKTVTLDTSEGRQVLMVKVDTGVAVVATFDAAALIKRAENIQMAATDRQAVFKSAECAKCHADLMVGKLGEPLYNTACGVCHESPHRATMVPNLRRLEHPTDRTFWRQLITHGKPGSLMPAFAKIDGGPLDDGQIDSLVEYLSREFSVSSSGAAAIADHR